MKLILPTVAALLVALSAAASTFFIDSVTGSDANTSAQAQSTTTPWAHCPGMSGATGNAASYSVQPGDSFCLKGGSTWTFASTTDDLLTVPASGITFQGGQQLATAWGNGYPVLDGTGTTMPRHGISSTSHDNLTVDGLKIQNVGYPSTAAGSCCYIVSSSHVEIKNCWLQPEGIEAFAYDNNSVNEGFVSIHNNHICRAGRAVIYGEYGSVLTNTMCYSNVWEGPGNTFLGSYHTDGLMFGQPTRDIIGAATVVGLQFHHNIFYGDWSQNASAQLFSNCCTSNTWIYDNQFAFDSLTASPEPLFPDGFIGFGGNDAAIYIFNNTFSSAGLHGYDFVNSVILGAHTGIDVSTPFAGTTVTIENNIFDDCAIDITGDPATYVIDYNLHRPDTTQYGDIIAITGLPWITTLAAAQAAGYETHGIVGSNPLFVAAPNGATGSGNWRLQAGSPAIGAGANLSAVFNTDLDGKNRSAPWSIGAYVAPGLADFGSVLSGGVAISGGVTLR